jgi:hypothetical protein
LEKETTCTSINMYAHRDNILKKNKKTQKKGEEKKGKKQV